jgi:hypothetical protein
MQTLIIGFSLKQPRPGFSVDLCGATKLHAAFLEESRTSLLSTKAVSQLV